jgi:hypothetical protein
MYFRYTYFVILKMYFNVRCQRLKHKPCNSYRMLHVPLYYGIYNNFS